MLTGYFLSSCKTFTPTLGFRLADGFFFILGVNALHLRWVFGVLTGYFISFCKYFTPRLFSWLADGFFFVFRSTEMAEYCPNAQRRLSAAPLATSTDRHKCWHATTLKNRAQVRGRASGVRCKAMLGRSLRAHCSFFNKDWRQMLRNDDHQPNLHTSEFVCIFDWATRS